MFQEVTLSKLFWNCITSSKVDHIQCSKAHHIRNSTFDNHIKSFGTTWQNTANDFIGYLGCGDIKNPSNQPIPNEFLHRLTTGACCITGTFCQELDAATCGMIGPNAYKGDGTDCATATCP